MMSADPALALTVAYLRLNGYFILTEQELHIREPVGYRALTDIDMDMPQGRSKSRITSPIK